MDNIDNIVQNIRALSPAQELQQMRKERLTAMSRSLLAGHCDLYSVLKKKQPSQMAKIIAQAFEQFYPEVQELQAKVLKHLYPGFAKKQPISFAEVNRRLASLENIFDEDSPCLELVESLRQIFEVLPKPGNRYRKERTIDQKDADVCFPPEKIEHHKCRFCWRTVWRYPIENGTPLCPFHNFKSTDSEYKRRKRLLDDFVPSILSGIHGKYRQLQRDIQKQPGSKLTNEDYALLMCFMLPHVRKFLSAKLKRDVHQYDLPELRRELWDFFTKREHISLWDIPPDEHFEYMRNHTPPGAKPIRAIIDTLDPAVNLSGSLALAREQFVLDMTWNFAGYISYIYETEAWLEAEELSKHGGMRLNKNINALRS